MNAQTKVEPVSLGALLAQVLPSLGAVHKNKKNPAFKSNYADLSAVLTAIAPIAEHGLWFRQTPIPLDGGVGIETFYIHESGAELSAGITHVPVNKNDAQGLGSALSYGRRYGLLTAFGLSAEDDDGNAAARTVQGQSQRSGAVSPDGPAYSENAVEPAATRTNWGGRYPTKTALKQAMHTHHSELNRLSVEGTFDDLEAYLSSPEYQDYVRQAMEHAPAYLEGPLPDNAPKEFVQTFTLEQKARDLIALRGNIPADVEQ